MKHGIIAAFVILTGVSCAHVGKMPSSERLVKEVDFGFYKNDADLYVCMDPKAFKAPLLLASGNSKAVKQVVSVSRKWEFMEQNGAQSALFRFNYNVKSRLYPAWERSLDWAKSADAKGFIHRQSGLHAAMTDERSLFLSKSALDGGALDPGAPIQQVLPLRIAMVFAANDFAAYDPRPARRLSQLTGIATPFLSPIISYTLVMNRAPGGAYRARLRLRLDSVHMATGMSAIIRTTLPMVARSMGNTALANADVTAEDAGVVVDFSLSNEELGKLLKTYLADAYLKNAL